MYKRGKKIYTKFFKVYCLSSDSLKVSPVVSKKISKKAVVRNRIKRKIRHLFKDNFKKGLFVVIALRDVSEIDFKELLEDVKQNRPKIDSCL